MTTITLKKGEITTILTIGTFLVLTASTLISSVFLTKGKQTTTSKAAVTCDANVCPIKDSSGNITACGESCSNLSKCDINGGCNSACCDKDSDCANNQTCGTGVGANNGYCQTNKSCDPNSGGTITTPTPPANDPCGQKGGRYYQQCCAQGYESHVCQVGALYYCDDGSGTFNNICDGNNPVNGWACRFPNSSCPGPTKTPTATPVPQGGACTSSDCSPACTGGKTCSGTKPNCACTGGDTGESCENKTCSGNSNKWSQKVKSGSVTGYYMGQNCGDSSVTYDQLVAYCGGNKQACPNSSYCKSTCGTGENGNNNYTCTVSGEKCCIPSGGGGGSQCTATNKSCQSNASIKYNQRTAGLTTYYYPASDTTCTGQSKSIDDICRGTSGQPDCVSKYQGICIDEQSGDTCSSNNRDKKTGGVYGCTGTNPVCCVAKSGDTTVCTYKGKKYTPGQYLCDGTFSKQCVNGSVTQGTDCGQPGCSASNGVCNSSSTTCTAAGATCSYTGVEKKTFDGVLKQHTCTFTKCTVDAPLSCSENPTKCSVWTPVSGTTAKEVSLQTLPVEKVGEDKYKLGGKLSGFNPQTDGQMGLYLEVYNDDTAGALVKKITTIEIISGGTEEYSYYHTLNCSELSGAGNYRYKALATFYGNVKLKSESNAVSFTCGAAASSQQQTASKMTVEASTPVKVSDTQYTLGGKINNYNRTVDGDPDALAFEVIGADKETENVSVGFSNTTDPSLFHVKPDYTTNTITFSYDLDCSRLPLGGTYKYMAVGAFAKVSITSPPSSSFTCFKQNKNIYHVTGKVVNNGTGGYNGLIVDLNFDITGLTVAGKSSNQLTPCEGDVNCASFDYRLEAYKPGIILPSPITCWVVVKNASGAIVGKSGLNSCSPEPAALDTIFIIKYPMNTNECDLNECPSPNQAVDLRSKCSLVGANNTCMATTYYRDLGDCLNNNPLSDVNDFCYSSWRNVYVNAKVNINSQLQNVDPTKNPWIEFWKDGGIASGKVPGGGAASWSLPGFLEHYTLDEQTVSLRRPADEKYFVQFCYWAVNEALPRCSRVPDSLPYPAAKRPTFNFIINVP